MRIVPTRTTNRTSFTRWALAIGGFALLGLTASACGEVASSSCEGCLGGCCRSGECVLPGNQTNASCGTNGQQCDDCASRGQTCNSGLGTCEAGQGTNQPDCGGRCNPATQICQRVANSNQTECVNTRQNGGCNPGQCSDPSTGACLFEGQPCTGGATCRNGQCATVQNQRVTGIAGCSACTTLGSAAAQSQCCDTQTQRCVHGDSGQSCGYGTSCRICTGGQTCVNGICKSAAEACSAKNCNGCCARGVCKKLGELRTDGVTDLQCGWGGATCQSCGYQRVCDKVKGTCGAKKKTWRICIDNLSITGLFNQSKSTYTEYGFNLGCSVLGSPLFVPTLSVGGKTVTYNDTGVVTDTGIPGSSVTNNAKLSHLNN